MLSPAFSFSSEIPWHLGFFLKKHEANIIYSEDHSGGQIWVTERKLNGKLVCLYLSFGVTPYKLSLDKPFTIFTQLPYIWNEDNNSSHTGFSSPYTNSWEDNQCTVKKKEGKS